MKKFLFLLPAIFLFADCEQIDLPKPNEFLEPLPEEMAVLKKETSEDLGMNDTQKTHLHQGLILHGKLPNKPGFLWLVARHLHENLPIEEKTQLLNQIASIEDHLIQKGQCIPLGLEVNLRHPIGPRPELILPLLQEPQKPPFQMALSQYKSRAKALIELRITDQISPPRFYGAMQENFNKLMATIVKDILLPPQREQLVNILQQKMIERQQYIRKSYECMAHALGLEEEKVKIIVESVMIVETQKQNISTAFHQGDISMEEAIHLIRTECENYFGTLENSLNPDQLEIARIYRALSFRPRN